MSEVELESAPTLNSSLLLLFSLLPTVGFIFKLTYSMVALDSFSLFFSVVQNSRRAVFSFPECTLNHPRRLICPVSVMLYPLNSLGLKIFCLFARGILTVGRDNEMDIVLGVNLLVCLQVVHDWSLVSHMLILIFIYVQTL